MSFLGLPKIILFLVLMQFTGNFGVAFAFEAPIQNFNVLLKIKEKNINSPTQVKFYQGSLYILDGLSSEMHVYSFRDKQDKKSFSLLGQSKEFKVNAFDIYRDQVFALSAEGKVIHVFSINGEFIKDIKLTQFSKPRSLAVLGDGKIIITDVEKKNIFLMQDEKTSDSIVSNIKLNTPVGLLPINQDEVIFSDYLRKVVVLQNLTTQKNVIVDRFKDKKVDLFAPRALASDSENIYISDTQVGLVHVVKLSAQNISYIGVLGHSQKPHLFRYPLSMSYSSDLHYLAVADLLNQEIVILKKEEAKVQPNINIPELGNFHQNDSRQCLLCHDGSVADSLHIFFDKNKHHPTELSITTQKNKIPSDVPNLNGKLVCLSCHTLHQGGDRESFFRFKAERDSNWCSKCHNYDKQQHALNEVIKDQSTVNEMKKLGAHFGKGNKIICETCHTVYSLNKNKNKLVMDAEHADALCKTCHESSFKSDINHTIDSKHMKNTKTCLNCHTIDHNSHRQARRLVDTSSKLCLDCHKNEEHLLNSKHDNKKWDASIHKDIGVDKDHLANNNTCLSCHSMHGSILGSRLLARITEREKGTNKDDVSLQCLSCHAKGQTNINLYQHETPLAFNQLPQNIFDQDSKSIKISLYDSKGDPIDTLKPKEQAYLGCASCHDAHNAAKSVSPITFMKNSFDMVTFCVACHQGEGLTRFKFFHTDKYRAKSDKK